MGQIRKHQVVHIITGVEHAGTSGNNNPTYRVTFLGGESALTETDAMVGYAATNFARAQVEPDVAVIVTFTRAGRITAIERPDDQDYYLTMVGRTISPTLVAPAPTSRVRHGHGGNHA
jgi:hypothetical protein